MACWFRIFSPQEQGLEPSRLMDCLDGVFPGIHGKFRADEEGWFQVVLTHELLGELPVDRFLSTEKGVRAQLNTWAAWFETKDRPDLMERMIQVKEILAFELPPEVEPGSEESMPFRALTLAVAQLVAGICHVDGVGFLDTQDQLIIADEAGLMEEEE